jgi:hypothetical protein
VAVTLQSYMKKLEGLAVWHANNKKALHSRKDEIRVLREKADILERSLEDLQIRLVNDNHLPVPLKESLMFFYQEGRQAGPEGFNCTFDRAYNTGFKHVRLNNHDMVIDEMMAMGWAESLSRQGLVVQTLRLTPFGLEQLARALQIPKEPEPPAPQPQRVNAKGQPVTIFGTVIKSK